MTNLFAFRAVRPVDMKAIDSVGQDNDRHIVELALGAGVVVAAWGTNGTYLGRNAATEHGSETALLEDDARWAPWSSAGLAGRPDASTILIEEKS